MNDEEIERKYGHLLSDPEFMKAFLRMIWRKVKKMPHVERALIEKGFPRRFEKHHFTNSCAELKGKRKIIH
jgi:hypothetical protein